MGPQVREEDSGAAETVMQMLVFAANLQSIEAHHLTHPDQRLRLNALAVVTFKEFKAAYVAPRRGHLILPTVEGWKHHRRQ